jgi:RimJ/RimL family protein N-acetyltransferase
MPAAIDVVLRPVTEEDLAIFYEQQRDAAANVMAAFAAKDPSDHGAFRAKWTKILSDGAITTRTIVAGGQVAGHVMCFPFLGRPTTAYWLGRQFWGRGIATAGLRQLVALVSQRPLYAQAAKDNLASLRVLAKCGFQVIAEDRGFSHARGEDVEEWVLQLSGMNSAVGRS